MYCPKCGAAVNPGTKFCSSCGNDLSTSNQTNQANQTVETAPQQESNVSTNIQTEQVNLQKLEEHPVEPAPANQNIAVPQAPTEQAYIQPGLNAPQPQKSSSSKMLIFIIFGVIVLIGAVIGIISLLPKSESKKEAEKIERKFETDKPIPVKKGDKYGYINTKGKFVISPTYDAANEFVGDYAVVKETKNVEGIELSNYLIINKKGKVIKESPSIIKYIEDDNKWLIDYILYDENMKQISPKETRVSEASDGYYIWVSDNAKTGGIMNNKGKKTYTYEFQGKESYITFDVSDNDESLTENYCLMNIDNDKYAIVNCDTGTVVMDYVTNYLTDKDDNIFGVCKENSYSTDHYVYIQNDKIAYRTPNGSGYDVSLTYYPGYVQIRDRNKEYSERYTYLHTDTLKEEKTTPSGEDEPEELDEWEKLTSNKKMTCDAGYGLISEEKIILPCEYSSLKYLDIDLYKYLKSQKKNYIYGHKDDKWYLIDLNTKKTVYEFNANYIYQEKDTTFMTYTDKDTKELKIFNLITGKTLSVKDDDNIYDYYHSNYVQIKDKNTDEIKYYNTDLELIYTETKKD